ncbi:hypothetical protein [uncultured Gammaproteobacteria bacterium]|nr:hypothetical protein [uncultured Gammaproteobacteria bacterium]
MTTEELITKLSEMYENAPPNDSTTMITLFGIKYANELRDCGNPITEIARRSSISDNYDSEISLGMRLEKYVKVADA